MQKIRFYQNKEDLTPAIVFLTAKGTIENVPTEANMYGVVWHGNKVTSVGGYTPVDSIRSHFSRISEEEFRVIEKQLLYEDGDITLLGSLATMEYKVA